MMYHQTEKISLCLICTLMFLQGCSAVGLDFEYCAIDSNGTGRTAIGDIDGDGCNDVVAHTWASRRGKDSNGSVAWYRYPDWKKSIIIDNEHIFGDAVLVVDLDGDGDNDVVTCKGNDNSAQVWWLANPGGGVLGWKQHKVDTVETGSEVKDIEVHDIDHDGKADIVVRTKHKFSVYFQDGGDRWTKNKMDNPEREGMTMGDIDGDGDYDAVMNGFWLENPPNPRTETWKRYNINSKWYADVTGQWQDHSIMADVADFNGDGRADVVLSQSEKTGFHITWYESRNPKAGLNAWTEHKVAVVDYCHSLQAGDMDLDGDVDIVAGTLIRSSKPTVLVFVNNGNGLKWTSRLVDNKSIYKAEIGDIDNDGDLDITSALSWEEVPLQLWRNTTRSGKTCSDG